MRWDLIASPELQNWLHHRDDYDMTSEARRFWPFWTSGRSTQAIVSYFERVQQEFGNITPEIATIADYQARVEVIGGQNNWLKQARVDCKRIGLWEEAGNDIRFTPLGENFFNRVTQGGLLYGGELRGSLRPRVNAQQRILETSRCFELLEAGHEIADPTYCRYYHTYCRIREYLPLNLLPNLEQQGTYDEGFQLADFFHLLHWLNLNIAGYNPFDVLVQALEESGEYIEELSIQYQYLVDTFGFNLYDCNFMANSWNSFQSRSTPMLMWIHAMERMASGGVAPQMFEVEEVIEGEPVTHIPVLGVAQNFNQNTTQLFPDGVQNNPPAVEVQGGVRPHEPRPGDIYFVVRFVRVESGVPRLLPLAKVGAAWPSENNHEIPPSLLREVGARRETNFPLFDSEGRMIEHLTLARFVCSDTSGLEGSTGLRGHLDDEGFSWIRMEVTRQRENVLLFGELGQDLSQIQNEQRRDRLREALQAMRAHPNHGHWANIERFEIVRPELLVEFGIDWAHEDDFVPWF